MDHAIISLFAASFRLFHFFLPFIDYSKKKEGLGTRIAIIIELVYVDAFRSFSLELVSEIF